MRKDDKINSCEKIDSKFVTEQSNERNGDDFGTFHICLCECVCVCVYVSVHVYMDKVLLKYLYITLHLVYH